jgi:uncharacterized protein
VPFLGVQIEAGQVTRTRVRVGEYGDGTEILLPVVTVGGGKDGPTLFVQAGLHGDEQTGIAICRGFLTGLKDMDIPRMKGRLVVVPIANPPSHLSRSRGYLHEERRMIDINRVFPGDRAGLISERIANILFEEFVRPSDVCVDLHSALDGCTIAPFVYVDPADDNGGTLQIRERLARAFGTPYLYYRERGKRFGTSDVTRSLNSQADLIAKPILIAEMGQSQVVSREYVDIGVKGLNNVMHALQMVEGDPQSGSSQRRFSEIRLVHANRGGGFEPAVAIGDVVTTGQRLGTIFDSFGQPIEEFTSPVNGFILRLMLFGTVATGAEVFWVAA